MKGSGSILIYTLDFEILTYIQSRKEFSKNSSQQIAKSPFFCNYICLYVLGQNPCCRVDYAMLRACTFLIFYLRWLAPTRIELFTSVLQYYHILLAFPCRHFSYDSVHLFWLGVISPRNLFHDLDFFFSFFFILQYSHTSVMIVFHDGHFVFRVGERVLWNNSIRTGWFFVDYVADPFTVHC